MAAELQEFLKTLRSAWFLAQALGSAGVAVVALVALVGHFYWTQERERDRDRQIEQLDLRWGHRLSLVEERLGVVGTATAEWGRSLNRHDNELQQLLHRIALLETQLNTTSMLVATNKERLDLGAPGLRGAQQRLRELERRLEGRERD